ncbi:Dna2/Cas4 domain-containing protein [Candidatus Woesearchaeota archaeon]|nr:Dna2/Cas4 domain-containing protein [Candidatus Woesearchaeota archaeon]
MERLLPAHFLQTYHFCPRKLYLEENYRMRPPRTKGDLKRAILDEALKYTNRAEPGVVKSINAPTTEHRVADKYYDSNRRSLQEAIINNKEALAKEGMSIIDTHKQLWYDLRHATKARVRSTYEFMAKNRVYGNELWWQLIPKITFNLKLSSEKYGVEMTIYRVDNYPHSAVPHLITRQDPPERGVWQNHRTELALAMLLLAEQGLIVQEGVVDYANGTTERRLEMTADLHDHAQELVRRIRETLKSKDPPPRVDNPRKCDRCPHKEQCYDDQYMQAKKHEHTGQVTF